ncbi:MAG: hypothetical protein F4107_05240 [Gemmatimonadetes bacterium]|nr:hypothetical protein [Gemmatimonadota bacterium]
MSELRPEKEVMREFWLEEAKAYSERYPEDTDPLFLTLPGPAAYDVRLLIDQGLLALTESGAIAEDQQFRVVCIERNGMAVAELIQQFPGMKIIEGTVENLLAWQSQFNWPAKKDRRLFRARVVNLDLNTGLIAQSAGGLVVFPVIEVIRKLLEIHAGPQPLQWTLCLTLNGTIPWPVQVAESAQAFMRENLGRDDEFRVRATNALTKDFVERLVAANTIDFKDLDRVEQQRFLMVFVPKKIAQVVQNLGWRLVTKHNFRYGTPPNAPMAAWILEFIPAGSLISTPDAGYRKALREIFSNFTQIASDGSLGKA